MKKMLIVIAPILIIISCITTMSVIRNNSENLKNIQPEKNVHGVWRIEKFIAIIRPFGATYSPPDPELMIINRDGKVIFDHKDGEEIIYDCTYNNDILKISGWGDLHVKIIESTSIELIYNDIVIIKGKKIESPYK